MAAKTIQRKRRYRFAEFLSASSPDYGYQWNTLEEDIPLDLVDFHVKAIEVIDGDKAPTTVDDSLKITFREESGRDRFEQLDKFFLAGVDIPLNSVLYTKTDNDTGSGATEWYIAVSSDTTAITDLSDAFQDTWTTSTTVQKEPYSFRGLITDYTMPTSLGPYIDSNNVVDLSSVDATSIVLVFNCIDDGTAEEAFVPCL